MIRMLDDDELASLAGTETGFGALETEKGCLPLVSLDLDVKIDGLVAHGTVSQCFRNVFADPLEATYVFPLPPRAAVIGFRMIVDGAVIEGRIDERGKARADYDEAIARGQSAAIAEEERADVFTIRVGNIPARSLARVEFTLVEPLSIDSLEATYRFPLVVSPRYCPGATVDGDPTGDGIQPDTDLVPDASRISPPVLLPGFPNPVRLGIRVAICGPAPLAEELAASLPVKLIQEHDTLHLVVEPGQRLDRDFVLRWPLGLGSVPKASFAIEPDAVRPVGMGRKEGSVEAPGDGTFSLVVFPPRVAAESRPPRDVVFLLDRSGSMEGWQIAAARRAIARTLDTLSSDDRLAVLAFDNTVETHSDSPTLVPATDRNRWATLEWLGKVEARGGTEMESALEAGLALLNRRKKKANPKPAANEASARDPILILVTDGQIGDEDRVLARLEKSLGATTLHVVGIDTAANAGLLTRLADKSGGTHDIVESEDRLDAVMDRLQERLVAPIVTDVHVEGEGIAIVGDSLVPAKRPSLFPGVPLVLRGRMQGTGPGKVTIRGKKQGGGTWRIDVTPHPTAAPGLGALWARGRLQQLTDAYVVAGHGEGDATTRKLVDLSTGFGVLCRHTAVVAIDPRMPAKATDAAAPRQIVQPIDALHRLRAPAVRQALRLTAGDPRRAFKFLSTRSNRISELMASLKDPTPTDLPLTSPLACPTEGLEALAGGRRPDRSAEQAMIREALSLSRPRSGRLDDVPPETVKMLLDEVSKVLGSLRTDGSSSPLVEALERSSESLANHPADRDALLRLLETLADFAEPVARWWRGEATASVADDRSPS